jgi:uncharacterized membrane protein
MARILRLFSLLILTFTIYIPVNAQSNPLVRAVLFYSTTCPHCHEVINNSLPVISNSYNESVEWFYLSDGSADQEAELPPFVEMRGNVLQVLFVNTQTEQGSQLYLEMTEQFDIPQDRFGVPAFLVGDVLLVGSFEIPDQLPGIIDRALENDGLDWPDLPGLQEYVAGMIPFPETYAPAEYTPTVENQDANTSGEEEPLRPTPESAPGPVFDVGSLSITDKFMQDPIGNTLSVIVLIGMVLSIVGVFLYAATNPDGAPEEHLSWIIPVLTGFGMLVAGYLTFVETTGAEAVCGPVGDCNTVQQSPYAMLFGVLPVGLLGLLGYVGILTGWLVSRFTSGQISRLAVIAVFVMAFIGTLFSIYLTILEPFVIGATCAWCLTSAINITILTWLSVRPATTALKKMVGE